MYTVIVAATLLTLSIEKPLRAKLNETIQPGTHEMHYDMDELLIDEEHGKTVSRLEEIKLNIQKSMIHKSEIEHILMMINSM